MDSIAVVVFVRRQMALLLYAWKVIVKAKFCKPIYLFEYACKYSNNSVYVNLWLGLHHFCIKIFKRQKKMRIKKTKHNMCFLKSITEKPIPEAGWRTLIDSWQKSEQFYSCNFNFYSSVNFVISMRCTACLYIYIIHNIIKWSWPLNPH